MRELKDQLISALLVILTVAAVISAVINFQQQRKFHLPYDGAVWVDRATGVKALHVERGGPADRVFIRPGDTLISIAGRNIEKAVDVMDVLGKVPSYTSTEYVTERGGVRVTAKLIVSERVPDSTVYYQYVIGFAYLVIGLFVYLRRGNAAKALHFYVLCLVSFVYSCFHFTGKLNEFDQVIYYGNVIAGLLAPAIFLHFCLTFPEPRRWLRGKAIALYLAPLALGAIYLGLATGTLRVPAVPPLDLLWLLDRIWLGWLCFAYLAGALALGSRTPPDRRSDRSPASLKWLRNGAFFGVVPFLALYGVPYLMGAVPAHWMKLSVLSLTLIPLTWAYAHSPLPADGRGCHLPAGLRLHAGDAGGARRILRRDLRVSAAKQINGPRHGGHARPDGHLRVPADPELDAGTARPVCLLQGPVRLPAHADRICARAGIARPTSTRCCRRWPTG